MAVTATLRDLVLKFIFISFRATQPRLFPQLSQQVGSYLYTLANPFLLRPLSEYSIIKITLIKILNELIVLLVREGCFVL